MKHIPYVPESMKMKEFSWAALLLGLVMTVILGAANAYLGLRAGITIAATYPAAVIGMAVIRMWRGTILEENIARTAGSIGESVAAGAIFTLPAFVIAKVWPSFTGPEAYWKSTVLMVIGSLLGVLFVSLVRRALVEDPDLPFPESVAASEIHKAGQHGAGAAKFLFWNIGTGGLVYLLGVFKLFAVDKDFFFRVGELGRSFLRLGPAGTGNTVPVGATTLAAGPTVSPAYLGVGYIIGVRLASLQFAGGVIAWGVLVPLFLYFLGPKIREYMPVNASDDDWAGMAAAVWRFIVRPIAIGGMLVGAAYTMFKMRKNLSTGLARAFGELTGPKVDLEKLNRTERYMSSKVVLLLIGALFAVMCVLYTYLADSIGGGVTAAIVMVIVGFFFATISGFLVGVIGSSNNPISGLTLSTLIIAALLMVALGVTGPQGVTAVLGVASVVCVSSAVAGELLQDFKVGWLLGGTPRTIQLVELVAVVVASAAMYWPLWILNEANLKSGGIGFGDKALPAPQAGLMASLAQGIVGGEMAWPLIIVGMFFGIALIMVQVKSPMLVSVGMYLPFATTFAIFVGGVMRWIGDQIAERRGLNEAQRARVENAGVLVSSGLIAGEALCGLVTAYFAWQEVKLFAFFEQPSYLAGGLIILALAYVMIQFPLRAAGRADEPAPPTAMM
ncbi:OPT family oligopeptide transporter [Bryobacter aggregatus]|uniref:OPT family oligopeptide transporter n=1 Tax=Bryobacter aggregatus TaxID=360054 RepID=UPI001EE28D5D|nr:oligopeptide transporter, OPT family [Bryobacter aggregatus]